MTSNLIHDSLFLCLSTLVVVSAFLVVVLRNILHAAVALFFCLCGVAALYIFLGADFLGMSQILIYAGGILVLLIFGIFLTAKIYENKMDLNDMGPSKKIGALISVAIFALIWLVLSKAKFTEIEQPLVPTTKGLGDLLLTKYLLPFELVSILLLFAMVGAVLLVRKELKED
jgi:NADH:ubiquinone oxidoreductase subunit 6 (subunit J)